MCSWAPRLHAAPPRSLVQRRAAALVRAQRRRQLHRQLRAQAQGSAAPRLTAAAMAGAGRRGPGGRRRRAAALPARPALPTHHDPAQPCPRARRRAPGSASGPAWRPGARACSRACPWRTAAPGRPRAAAPPPRPHARAAPRGAARCAAPGLGRPGPRPALHPPASVQGGGARLPARAEGRTACRSAWAAPSALRRAPVQKHTRAAAGECTTALRVQGYCSPSPDAGCRCKAATPLKAPGCRLAARHCAGWALPCRCDRDGRGGGAHTPGRRAAASAGRAGAPTAASNARVSARSPLCAAWCSAARRGIPLPVIAGAHRRRRPARGCRGRGCQPPRDLSAAC